MTLHLTRQGATLRLRQGRLLLEEEGREVAGFPARQVRSVALWAVSYTHLTLPTTPYV